MYRWKRVPGLALTTAVAVELNVARKNSTQESDLTDAMVQRGLTVDLTEIDLSNGAWIRRLPEA